MHWRYVGALNQRERAFRSTGTAKQRHQKTLSRTSFRLQSFATPPPQFVPIKQAGVEIVDGPKQRPDGATQVFIRDPDGYLIELCSV